MKHAETLTLVIAGDTETYGGKAVPTGNAACNAMNIDQAALDEMRPLCQRLASFHTMLMAGAKIDKAAMVNARDAARQLLALISLYEPFTFLSEPLLAQRLNDIYSVESYRKIPKYSTLLAAGKLDEGAQEQYLSTSELLLLTPALANFHPSITLLKEHIAPFAESLDAAKAERTREAYLAQFQRSFPQDFQMGDGTDSWMSMTNVTVQYTAGDPLNTGYLVMQKHMHFISFGGLLRADFFEGLAVGHAPRKCAICGKWFLTTDARHTKYCSDICPTDPKGRKCRVIGNLKGREARERADDHPLHKPYQRRMNTIDQALKRGTIAPDLAGMMKKLAKDKHQRAIADLNYAKTAYEAEMQQDALKAEALKLLS